MNILIADDRPANLKVLRVTLQAEGHTVIEAADGREALEVLSREKVDVVISDILMPNMDGYRLCHEIRTSPALRTLPVILYSSTYLSPTDRKLALDFGANAFLEKPAPAGALADLLKSVTGTGAPLPAKILPEDLRVLKQYSERLIRKIEEKNIELAQRAEALLESEEKFRQMAENIDQLVWMMTVDMKTTLYVSPAYERVWGRPCKELYDDARTWMDSIYPADRERVLAVMQSPEFRAGPLDVEYRIVRPDESVRWIHNRSFPVRNPSGDVYRMTGIATDISERKSLEAQFRQAQKMEAIGRLAGGVAHDFNNLLTVINGFGQMLLMKLPEKDPKRAYAEQIYKAGERAASLTRQLLVFSRRQILQPRVLDLVALVRDMESMLRRLIGEDLELKTLLGTAPAPVHADPGQLEQVIMNLVVNARDAMPDGGRVLIEARRAEFDSPKSGGDPIPAGRYVVLTVTDSGCGMTDDVKAHLFEPFFTTKPEGKGTGLGLSTVFGVVKQSGGWIRAYSEVGKGTVFSIYLPQVEPEGSAAAASAPPGEHRGTETILLVEDEDSVRALGREVLESAGYRVLDAADGRRALAALDSHPGAIHLLMTDAVMPGMSGLQTSEAILAKRPGIKVLYLSGYTEHGALQKGLLAGEVNFLQKPFSPASLLQKVGEVLRAGT